MRNSKKGSDVSQNKAEPEACVSAKTGELMFNYRHAKDVSEERSGDFSKVPGNENSDSSDFRLNYKSASTFYLSDMRAKYNRGDVGNYMSTVGGKHRNGIGRKKKENCDYKKYAGVIKKTNSTRAIYNQDFRLDQHPISINNGDGRNGFSCCDQSSYLDDSGLNRTHKLNCCSTLAVADEAAGEGGQGTLMQISDGTNESSKGHNCSMPEMGGLMCKTAYYTQAECMAPIFFCDICSRSFKRRSSLKLHIFSHIYHADIFKCPMSGCCKGFKDLSSAISHIGSSHKMFKDTLETMAIDQKWSYNFKCYLVLNDFYMLTKQEDRNIFKDAFCFGCLSFPISLQMHPCSRKYTNLMICPACSSKVVWKKLKEHCFGGECTREEPIIKLVP